MLEPGEAKDPDDSTVFQVWSAFASEQQIEQMRSEFANGIAWGEAKKQLFALIDGELAEPREKYQQLLADKKQLEEILMAGAEKARRVSAEKMKKVKAAIGLRKIG